MVQPRSNHKISKMRALTANQIELLEAFYFGEVTVNNALVVSGGTRFNLYKFMWGDLDVSGRVVSLRRRKLIQFRYIRLVDQEAKDRAVFCTDAGREVIENASHH